jgi:hypothetical protein
VELTQTALLHTNVNFNSIFQLESGALSQELRVELTQTAVEHTYFNFNPIF